MSEKQPSVVLAFYPHARGFAYTLFLGPNRPIDCGMTDVRAKQDLNSIARRLERLLDRTQPEVLVLREIPKPREDKRSGRILEAMFDCGQRRGLPIIAISRMEIRQAFAHLRAPTRLAIANEITRNMPLLVGFVPPGRKIWNGEDRRMGLFDAVALALAFFKNRKTTRG